MRRLPTRLLAATACLAVAATALAACAGGDDTDTVTLVTHDSFVISKEVRTAFEASTGLRLRIVRNGDAGAALNQAILTKDAPLGDAFFGVDNTLVSRALAEDVFVRYTPKAAAEVPAALVIDPTHHVTDQKSTRLNSSH